MSDGTSPSLSKKLVPDQTSTEEKVSNFLQKIAIAQAEGNPYIETSEDIIQKFNPMGLNGAKYFIYHGVKVFPNGQAEKILEEEQIPIEQRIHKPETQPEPPTVA
jgi:hypothetical protein